MPNMAETGGHPTLFFRITNHSFRRRSHSLYPLGQMSLHIESTARVAAHSCKVDLCAYLTRVCRLQAGGLFSQSVIASFPCSSVMQSALTSSSAELRPSLMSIPPRLVKSDAVRRYICQSVALRARPGALPCRLYGLLRKRIYACSVRDSSKGCT